MAAEIVQLLQRGYEGRASDIHLATGVPPVFRINGMLEAVGDTALTKEDTERMARALIPDHLWDAFREKGELDFSYGLSDVARFRVNAYCQKGNISLAIRVLPASIPSLEELGLPETLKKIVEKPQGLFLVTGPTGSGKSTTLAAMIEYMNHHMNRHIITLEDPIEYVYRHRRCIINQREVGTDTSSFAHGLRAALRQDPDVILVGEMRDLETMATALTAAETGHLVLATLHTTDAPSTINRIIDVFPSEQQRQIRIQLASVLAGVLSQRLFPAIDGKKRIVATELLINTTAVENLIREQKVHQIKSIMQMSRAQGMHTLETALQALLQRGVVSPELIKPYLPKGVRG
ncbi:twitching motility protein [Caldalkalibacillus thermarum TA2.A1]|uniref:Twitching motility protein n=1 Tax=Caldalkalibacillus thermarum (strain TA2.A1) TaxID=986075 RepID=F5LAL8_CALTT|nr:type IV pilus twitching motility protein PilT [Caldalkalibacillus thermarum]EGL81590.1 twitching motility protein [Caldalkalibacillus thermarum TA2.A1]QZT33520.1 type IV pilus twitching motility protein PilT [Caldalkalibacillus thermarum TA2.A1]